MDDAGSTGPGPANVDRADPTSDDSSGSADIDGIGSIDVDGAGSTEANGADSADINGTGPVGVKTSQHSATNFTNSVPPVRFDRYQRNRSSWSKDFTA